MLWECFKLLQQKLVTMKMTVDLNHLMELKKHVKGFSIQKSQSGTSDRFEPLQRGAVRDELYIADKLEPADRIVFAGKRFGEIPTLTSMKITNTLKERIVFKVKCTSNEMFRILPPVGALKPNDNVTVSLQFNAGKTVPVSGRHYFVVYYIKATDEKKAPRATWTDHRGKAEGTKRLYIDFKKEDEEEKKDDKKEDQKDDKREEKKDDEKKEEKKEEKKKEEEKMDEKKDDDKEDDKKDEKMDDDKKNEKKDEKKEGGRVVTGMSPTSVYL